MIRPSALLLTLAGIVTATEARAQYVVSRGSTQPTTTYYSTPSRAPSYASTPYSSYYSGPASTYRPTRVYSYSYYTLSPLPARTYVGYGSNDFPYQGAPYGHPYDPWTWPMMSGAYTSGLARYYDPPVK